MPSREGADAFCNNNSQAEYPREMIDFSQLSIPTVFDTQEELAEDSQETQGIEDSDVAVADDVAETEPLTQEWTDNNNNNKKKRKRAKFAGRWLKATHSVYLNPNKLADMQVAHPDTYETITIVGQIKECPRGVRKHYRIEWDADIKGVDPNWLRSEVENTPEMKTLLLEAIELKEKDPPEESRKKRAKVVPGVAGTATATATGTATAAATGTAANKTTVTDSTSNTPPACIRAQAVANLRTSASTISSFSSLSQNTRSTSAASSVRTRGQKENASDAEESDSDNEDDLDLVEDPEEVIIGDRNVPTWEDDVSDVTGPHQVDDEERTTEEDEDVVAGLSGLMRQLKWKFESVDKEAPQKVLDPHIRRFYEGPEGLRPGVAESFNDPFECFQQCGGLDDALIARLASGSNDYFHKFKKPTLDRNQLWHGVRWKEITQEEMIHFLGILLRISMSPVDGGGYEAYFSKSNKTVIPGGNGKPLEISGTSGWAHKYMTLSRFKQIRGAFHPEDKAAGAGGDKCYQLRHVINTLNSAARYTFYTPKDLAFDEGGVGCRSRYCPVRQYNQSKPQKFRVEFFVCSGSRDYQILHLDVYQGKNGNNVGINKNCIDLPTSQKAVANAAYALGLDKETDGMRHVAMDNRYQCPELAVFLRERVNLYSTGTCRSNRKGWKEGGLDLKKKEDRGTYQMAYDDQNRILLTQWADSKVVNVVSSLNDTTITTCTRQIGSQRKTFACPLVIRKYQQDMGSVDRNDQMRMHGGGFSNKVHFKKWYKKVYLAVFDCMMLNAYIAWNMSVSVMKRRGRRELKRHDFFQYIFEHMLSYRSPNTIDATQSPEQVRKSTGHLFIGDRVHLPKKSKGGSRCAVCRLEFNWNPKKIGQKNLTTAIGTCKVCGISAHTTLMPSSHRHIHKLKVFENLTCFQIAHTCEGMELFRRGVGNKGTFQVNEKHPIYAELRTKHGLPVGRDRKKKQSSSAMTLDSNDSTTNSDPALATTASESVSARVGMDATSARRNSDSVSRRLLESGSDTDETETVANNQTSI